jgi:hypothetical protein
MIDHPITGTNEMIYMKQPSLVLHAQGIEKNGYLYKMWATWTAPKTLTSSVLVGWIEQAIDQSEELYLHNVIINCHGEPGYLHIGTGVGEYDLEPFKRLRQKQSIGRLWLVACRVHAKTGDSLGSRFCSSLAASAGCPVAAADELQVSTWDKIPYGYIDDFEGNLYLYNGAGNRDVL